MAQVAVHCPTCNVDDVLNVPDDYHGALRWEHGCPPEAGKPFQGIVQVGEQDRPVFPPVPDGVVAVQDADVGQAAQETAG